MMAKPPIYEFTYSTYLWISNYGIIEIKRNLSYNVFIKLSPLQIIQRLFTLNILRLNFYKALLKIIYLHPLGKYLYFQYEGH